MTNYDPQTVILDIEGNHWTLSHSFEGSIAFGATGSGKSSGPLYKIAQSFLKNNYGGLVLCAKADEADTWLQYAKEANREEDVLLLSKNSFNFLRYEYERPGAGAGQVENIASLFMEVAAIGSGDKQEKQNSSNEKYWHNAVMQLLRNTISLLIFADMPITLYNIKKIIDSSPKSLDEANNMGSDDSFCLMCMEIADLKHEGDPEYQLTLDYFLSEFARLAQTTRSNVVSSFTTVADPLLRGEIRRCFTSDETTVIPEQTFEEGKIIIVDYNSKEWMKAGLIAAGIMKYCFQRAVERRKKDSTRPVFLFVDECQYFSLPYDVQFQTTARSSRVCTVLATQNLPNLFIGYGRDGAKSLVGNLQTKFFCQNGDGETNKWASEHVGQHIERRYSKNLSDNSSVGGGKITSGKGFSEGWSEHKDFKVKPDVFTDFRKGGVDNKCEIDFIVWQPGRKFNNGKNFIQSFFKQTCELRCGTNKAYKCRSKKGSMNNTSKPHNVNVFQASDVVQFALFVISIFGLTFSKYLIIYNKNILFNDVFIEITLALVIIAFSGTIGFYLLSNVIWELPNIIAAFNGKSRKNIKYRYGLYCRESVMGYFIFSAIMTYQMNKAFVQGKTALIWGFCWLGGALLLKFLLTCNTRSLD